MQGNPAQLKSGPKPLCPYHNEGAPVSHGRGEAVQHSEESKQGWRTAADGEIEEVYCSPTAYVEGADFERDPGESPGSEMRTVRQAAVAGTIQLNRGFWQTQGLGLDRGFGVSMHKSKSGCPLPRRE
jgi:hypothetical protein